MSLTSPFYCFFFSFISAREWSVLNLRALVKRFYTTINDQSWFEKGMEGEAWLLEFNIPYPQPNLIQHARASDRPNIQNLDPGAPYQVESHVKTLITVVTTLLFFNCLKFEFAELLMKSNLQGNTATPYFSNQLQSSQHKLGTYLSISNFWFSIAHKGSDVRIMPQGLLEQ